MTWMDEAADSLLGAEKDLSKRAIAAAVFTWCQGKG